MPAIVGGWMATKKRGRDDDAIERDREGAIAKRKRLRSRTLHSKKGTQPETETESPVVSSSWVKPPCRTPRHRRHRSREPISPQRELFPKKKKKKNRVLGDHLRSTRQATTSEQCGDKLLQGRGSIQRSLEKPPRKRATIVTPDPQHKGGDLCCESETETAHHKRTVRATRSNRRAHPKILGFAGTRTRRRHHASAETRNKNGSMSKKQESAEGFVNPLLALEPDFCKSAQFLSETSRRRRKKGFRTCNGNAISTPSSNAIARRDSMELLPSTRQESHCSDDNSIEGAPNAWSETKFELLRNLLLGKNGLDNTKQTIDNSNAANIQSTTVGEEFPSKSINTTAGSSELGAGVNAVEKCNATLHSSKKIPFPRFGQRHPTNLSTNNTTSPSEPGVDAKKERNHELPQLSTQVEVGHLLLRDNPRDERPANTKKWNMELRSQESTIERHPSPKRSTLAEKNTNTGISSQPKKTVTNTHRSASSFLQQETKDENATPSQTPSTSSSAVLSLPMNYRFLSPPPPDDESRSSPHDTSDLQIRQDPHKASVRTGDGPAKTIRRTEEDPFKDIGFWQRIVEREEAKKNNGQTTTASFNHTIASLILAKNSGGGGGSRGNNGFLWLPSILQGGLDRTGLLDK